MTAMAPVDRPFSLPMHRRSNGSTARNRSCRPTNSLHASCVSIRTSTTHSSKPATHVGLRFHHHVPSLSQQHHTPSQTLVPASQPQVAASTWPCPHQQLLPLRTVTTAAGKRNSLPPVNTPHGSATHATTLPLLLDAGFTDTQARKVLASHSARKLFVNIDNVRQWLLLLRQHHVEQPAFVLSRQPVTLEKLAVNTVSNAAAVVQWMSAIGLTDPQIGTTLSKLPSILSVSLANIAAVDEWLRSELGPGDLKVAHALLRAPSLFCKRPATNLAPKLAWFRSHGFSDDLICRILVNGPTILSNSIPYIHANLGALRDMGLSPPQIEQSLRRRPLLLGSDLHGAVMQAKVRFLTQVMRNDIQVLVCCPQFLSMQLVGRIGPRWAFWSRHCPGQPFVLNTRLNVSLENFVSNLRSPSLDAECNVRNLTYMQLFEEESARWQAEEGAEWVVGGEEEGEQRDDILGVEAQT